MGRIGIVHYLPGRLDRSLVGGRVALQPPIAILRLILEDPLALVKRLAQVAELAFHRLKSLLTRMSFHRRARGRLIPRPQLFRSPSPILGRVVPVQGHRLNRGVYQCLEVFSL